MKKISTKNENLESFLQKEFSKLATKKDLEGSTEKLAVITQNEFEAVNKRPDRIEDLFLQQHEIKIDDLQKRLRFLEDTFAVNHKK